MTDQERRQRPSGWQDGGGSFWIKSSKYGQKYKCKLCSREVLGYHGADDYRMHWSSCEQRAKQESER
jgi:hypothetical protein